MKSGKIEWSVHLLNEFHFLNEMGRPQRLDAKFIFFRLRTLFFQKKRPSSLQNIHRGPTRGMGQRMTSARPPIRHPAGWI